MSASTNASHNETEFAASGNQSAEASAPLPPSPAAARSLQCGSTHHSRYCAVLATASVAKPPLKSASTKYPLITIAYVQCFALYLGSVFNVSRSLKVLLMSVTCTRSFCFASVQCPVTWQLKKCMPCRSQLKVWVFFLATVARLVACVKSQATYSDSRLIRWRSCSIMDGELPTVVSQWNRILLPLSQTIILYSLPVMAPQSISITSAAAAFSVPVTLVTENPAEDRFAFDAIASFVLSLIFAAMSEAVTFEIMSVAAVSSATVNSKSTARDCELWLESSRL
mmetsp:Transcript_8680/g.20989  ORF Transcript_8680/g.20989 Transcript_8680/m.20989 type:complete len:282 (+) Transcript_8680:2204-3049(+)